MKVQMKWMEKGKSLIILVSENRVDVIPAPLKATENVTSMISANNGGAALRK